MPDLVDTVQERQLAEIEAASAPREVRPGRDMCEECGEPISAQRKALGAALCLEHQQEAEAREAHFKRWSR